MLPSKISRMLLGAVVAFVGLLVVPERTQACPDLGVCDAPPVIEPTFDSNLDCLEIEVTREGSHGDEWEFRARNNCDAGISGRQPLFTDATCTETLSGLEPGEEGYLQVSGQQSCWEQNPPDDTESGEWGIDYDLYLDDESRPSHSMHYGYTIPTSEQAREWEDQYCRSGGGCEIAEPYRPGDEPDAFDSTSPDTSPDTQPDTAPIDRVGPPDTGSDEDEGSVDDQTDDSTEWSARGTSRSGSSGCGCSAGDGSGPDGGGLLLSVIAAGFVVALRREIV